MVEKTPLNLKKEKESKERVGMYISDELMIRLRKLNDFYRGESVSSLVEACIKYTLEKLEKGQVRLNASKEEEDKGKA